MITTIVCTACNQPIDLIGTSVRLPFICPPCEQIQQFGPSDQQVELDAPDAPETEPEPNESVECDTASVENTTALIADLEEQLTNSQQENSRLKSELIQTMVEDVVLLSAGAAAIEEAHAAEELSHMALAKALTRIHELAVENARLNTRVQEYQSRLKYADDRISNRDTWLRNYKERFYNASKDASVARVELRRLKGRSLWARIRNK